MCNKTEFSFQTVIMYEIFKNTIAIVARGIANDQTITF